MRSRWWFLVMLTLVVAACGGREASPSPAPVDSGPTAAERRLRTFEALWEAVDQQFVYDDFAGVDWEAARAETLPLVRGTEDEEEFAELLRGMLEKLPEGLARYETRAERIETEATDPVNYEGIGAFIAFRLEPEPHIVLLSVIPDSPAEQTGLLAHDSIYAIDGQPVSAEEGLGVIQRVRGPAGTDVTLTVQTPGESRREVTLQRARLASQDGVRGGLLGGTGILYMRVPTLGDENLANNLAQGLANFASQTELTGVILDLRIAHTGAGWPLNDLLSLFSGGEMGEFYTREAAEPLSVQGQDIAGSQTLPLILLIGPDTQGLPEVFAAALQASGRATLVGLPTPGAVEIPTEVPLPNGSRAFIARTSYRTPAGLDIGLNGLTPDAPVDADWDEVVTTTDQVIMAARDMLLLLELGG